VSTPVLLVLLFVHQLFPFSFIFCCLLYRCLTASEIVISPFVGLSGSVGIDGFSSADLMNSKTVSACVYDLNLTSTKGSTVGASEI